MTSSPYRQFIFADNMYTPRLYDGKRRRGRPRSTWTYEISQHISEMMDKDVFKVEVMDSGSWSSLCRKYCLNL